MTTPYWNSTQWADCGVNVGHAVYGDIHIHPPAPADRPRGVRHATTSPVSATRHAAVRSALNAFVRACERAVAALSSAGLMRPERRNDDID